MPSISDRFESPLSTTVFLVGTLLVISGAIGILLDIVSKQTVSGLGMWTDLDLGIVGIITVTGAVFKNHTQQSAEPVSDTDHRPTRPKREIYITRSLLETLLQLARQAEPNSLSIGLATTPAGELNGADGVFHMTPVFTHLYLPEQPNSVSSVFGVDLHTPPQRTQGRFVTHPFSELRLTKRDDLHEIVFVAVPPWDETSVGAFDRAGRRHSLRILDAVPPEEPLPQPKQ
ncbi:hypothetical protein [Natrialba aegyptia]|uniref:hypothetical protein n=1 Tax=Natrialba aegyptia TaxID=129789 RepID=UPI00269CC88B